MILSLLYVSGLAVAAFLGAIVGAGLVIAGLKPERELTVQAMAKLVESHIQVQALISATSELAKLNAQLLAAQPQDRIPALVVTPTSGKVN